MGRRQLAALTAAAVIAACLGCGDDVDDSFEPLGDAVRESARTNKPVQLVSVTGFEWDRAYAFPPYWTSKDISRTLGFEWGGESKENDAYGLLVFVADGEVVRAFDQYVGDGDLVCLSEPFVTGGLTPDEAVLRVSTTPLEDGRPYYVVTLARPRNESETRRTKRCLRTYT